MHFIKSYTAGEEAQWKGASMHSDWIRRPPPVYVACNGPKACHLAGEIADGSTIAGAIDPQIMKWKIELITKGAREAGRDRAKIDIWVTTSIGVAESLLELVEPGLVDELRQLHDAYDPYDPESTETVRNELVSQTIVDLFLLTGTEEEVCNQIHELGQVGVKGIFNVLPSAIDGRAAMREIGERIIPHFAR